MANFEAKTVCILGRQPAIGLAELEVLYGAEHVRPIKGAALLDIEAGDINFKKLGGTIRVAKILNILPYHDWARLFSYLKTNIPKHIKYLPEGKLRLGISLYGINVQLNTFNKNLLKLKQAIKVRGKSVRIVPNKAPELNSAQVLHNKLTHKGGWELLLIADGQQTILAQTMFVQDIDAYAARDQKRPKRDARVGMLPPKLAQIIINLALPDPFGEKKGARILDPFCGTGVILQETLLMGYNVIGTDIEPRMVEFSTVNIQWLVKNYPKVEGQVVIEPADATNCRWPRFSAVASEVYLGRALNSLPAEGILKQIIADTNTIIRKFLVNLAPQLRCGQRLCLALPAWRKYDNFIHLPVVEKLKGLGYNHLNLVHVSKNDLIYFRENQIVARELLILERS